MDKTTMDKVIEDMKNKKKYSAREVMSLLQIDEAGLRLLEQEGKLQKLDEVAGWARYSPFKVARLLAEM